MGDEDFSSDELTTDSVPFDSNSFTEMGKASSLYNINHSTIHWGDKYYFHSTEMGENGEELKRPLTCHHKPAEERKSILGLSEDDHKRVAEIKTFLQDIYREQKAWTIPLPWNPQYQCYLKNFYTTLQLLSTNSNGEQKKDEEVNFEKILSQDSEQTCRVLVEGNPGFGKTTLALKLAYDWATGAPYMAKYFLVYLFHLRDFQGDFRAYLMSEGFPLQKSDNRKHIVWEYIDRHEKSVLFILDGLDELNENCEDEIKKLMDKKMFANCDVIVTTRPLESDNKFLSCFRRRLTIKGFSDEQIRTYVRNYFLRSEFSEENVACGTKKVNMLLKILIYEKREYKCLARCPLLCLLLCVLFEDNHCNLPSKVTSVYSEILNLLIRFGKYKSENKNWDEKECTKHLCTFGEMCLKHLAENKVYFEEEKIKQSCAMVLQLGFLIKSYFNSNSKIDNFNYYQPLHKSFIEFLAAYHISGVVKDLTMSSDDENLQQKLDKAMMKLRKVKKENRDSTLKYLLGLLDEHAHLVIPQVSVFDSSPMFLMEFLKDCDYKPPCVESVLNVLATKPSLTIERGEPVEIIGWKHILLHLNCPIISLHFTFNETCTEQETEFFNSISSYHSVIYVTLHNIFRKNSREEEQQIQHIASCISKCIRMDSIVSLEITLTCLEALDLDPIAYKIAFDFEKFKPRCLEYLTLNISFNERQIQKICEGLQHLSKLQRLNLPKLPMPTSNFDHFKALALLSASPACPRSLSLSLDWTSNGISDLINNVISCPTDKAFEKLMDMYASTQEPPRQEAKEGSVPSDLAALFRVPDLSNIEDHLRICPTKGIWLMVHPSDPCSPQLPLPLCDNNSHNSGFHELFDKLSNSQLTGLSLTNCCLSTADFACLGDALRKATMLESLEKIDVNDVVEVFPVFTALYENRSLKSVDISSTKPNLRQCGSPRQYVQLDDFCFRVLCNCLAKNDVIRELSLNNWRFSFREEKTVSDFINLMKCSKITDLSLKNVRIEIFMPNYSSDMAWKKMRQFSEKNLKNNSLRRLVLDGCILTVKCEKGSVVKTLQGPKLVQLTGGLGALKEMDLSVIPTEVTPIDDELLCKAFSFIASKLNGLQSLRVCNWKLELEHPSSTMDALGRSLQCLKLQHLSLNEIVVKNYSHSSSTTAKCLLLQTVIAKCTKLKRLSMCIHDITVQEAKNLGLSIANKWSGSQLDLHIAPISCPSIIDSLCDPLVSSDKVSVSHSGNPVECVTLKSRKKTSSVPCLKSPFLYFFIYFQNVS